MKPACQVFESLVPSGWCFPQVYLWLTGRYSTCPPTEANSGGCGCLWLYIATVHSFCSCGVLLSLVSFPQIQPSEGAAAQMPLAANTDILAHPGAQAGVRDGDSCTGGHSTSGHSCACPPCVRLTLVMVSDSMLSSCSASMHCSH